MLYEKNKDFTNEYALWYFNRKITYGELLEKIQLAAASFYSLGVRKGDVVSLQLLNTPQTAIVFYALSYLGAVANIIYITSSEQEIKDSLVNTTSKMYVTLDALWAKNEVAVRGTGMKHILLLNLGEEADILTKTVLALKKASVPKECLSWTQFLKLGNGSAPEVNEPDLPVAMVYTSGTTGKSKAVMLSNKCLNALALQYEYSGISRGRGDIFMNSLPPFIAFGLVFAMHMPLCLGFVEVLVVDPSPTNAGNSFSKYKPNLFVHGKAAIEDIIANKKVRKMDLSFVHVLAAGGESIPPVFEKQVQEFLRKHNSDNVLSIGYGMTEVAATVVTSSPSAYREGTVGIPLPGTNVKIIDMDSGQEVPYGVEGEICFNAPTTMLGYYKQEDESRNILRTHEDGLLWVHSGDIGKMNEDGFLTVVGRIKRIVGIRENGIYHKVFPKLLEDVLEKVEGVNAISIVGRAKPLIENELIAFIVLSSDVDRDYTLERLRTKATDELEPWECPIEYRVISALPRTTVGKVDYQKLEMMAQNSV